MKRPTKIILGTMVLALVALVVIIKMPTPVEKLQAELAQAQRDILEIKKSLGDTKNYSAQDPRFRQSVERVVDDFLSDKILDLLWDNYFIYSTLFESLDGWLTTDVGGGTATVDGGGVDITTGAVSGNNTRIEKYHTFQDIFSFDKDQRFRTGFEIGNASNLATDQTILIVVGDTLGGGGIDPAYYGFEIASGVLKGISTPDGASFSRTVNGETIAVNTVYEIQAKLKSKDKIVFYVKKENVDDVFREIGTINSDIPYTGVSTNDVPVFTYKITTNENEAKTIKFSSFEFAQKKIKIR